MGVSIPVYIEVKEGLVPLAAGTFFTEESGGTKIWVGTKYFWTPTPLKEIANAITAARESGVV